MPTATKNLRQARRAVKHGLHTSPDVLRVPAKYEGVYQEFLKDDKPFDLRRELALLRVLHCRMEEALTNRGLDSVLNIQERIQKKLIEHYGEKTTDPEKLDKLASLCSHMVTAIVQNELGLASLGIGLDGLADLLVKISVVAERMKKIQEGIKLQVNIDTSVLITFLQTIVFKHVRDHSARQEIIQDTMRMAVPNRPDRQLHGEDRGTVTPENVNPLGTQLEADYHEVAQIDTTMEEFL